ncbi:MAG: Rieske 2Fe-2S domain-containing protein [Nitrospinae bacterium]|nr:Rieske 2Fe-2S domain-containing protein [Nitrospinota bacterium]
MKEKVNDLLLPKSTRRSFLNILIGLGFSVLSVLTVYPIIRYLWPSMNSGGTNESWITISLTELPNGKSKVVVIGGKPVIVVRTNEEVFALSAVCTHLGCIVKWDASLNRLICPCHAASFDLNGNVLGGPAPKPLSVISTKIVRESILIGKA